MNGTLLAAAGTAAILLIGEYLWQKRILKGEFARKFVHILAAAYAAFWPLFVPLQGILLLGLIFIAVLITVKHLKIFNSVRSIKRVTYGEIWYVAGICASALLFKDHTIYAIAILSMALADGFAAIVGVALNKKAKNFHFMGYRKSVAGSLTFVVISFTLNMYYWVIHMEYPMYGRGIIVYPIAYSALSALVLAGVEIMSPNGSDNVVVPLIAGTLLWIPTILATSSILF
jgi:dolichol kinase